MQPPPVAVQAPESIQPKPKAFIPLFVLPAEARRISSTFPAKFAGRHDLPMPNRNPYFKASLMALASAPVAAIRESPLARSAYPTRPEPTMVEPVMQYFGEDVYMPSGE